MKQKIEKTIDELWRLWELTDDEGAEDALIDAIVSLNEKLNEMEG